MAALCAATLALAGCAGEEGMRNAASISASMYNNYGQGVGKFFDAENETLAAVDTRVKDLDSERQFVTGKVDIRRRAWATTNNASALRLYDNLAADSVEKVVGSSPDLQTLRPTAPPPRVTVDTKPYDAVVKSLTALAQEPSLSDRVSFLIAFGQQVAAKHKEMTEKSADKAKKDTANAKSLDTKPNNDKAKKP